MSWTRNQQPNIGKKVVMTGVKASQLDKKTIRLPDVDAFSCAFNQMVVYAREVTAESF